MYFYKVQKMATGIFAGHRRREEMHGEFYFIATVQT